jgi:hypothetical protein
VSSENLRKLRTPLIQEIENNPALKLRLAAIVDLENPGAGTAVAESLFNRSIYSDRSVAQGIAGGPKSFYGPARNPGMVEARMQELAKNPDRLAQRYAQINQAYSSNFVKGHTDQGSSGDPNYEQGGTGVNINRERFNDWGGGPGSHAGARAWREDLMRVANDDKGDSTMLPSYALNMKTPSPFPDVNAAGLAVGQPTTTGVPYANPGIGTGLTLTSTPVAGYAGSVGTAGGTNMVTPQGAAPIVPGPVPDPATAVAAAAPKSFLENLTNPDTSKDSPYNQAMGGLDDVAKGLHPKAAAPADAATISGMTPQANQPNQMAFQLMAQLLNRNRGLTLTGQS